MRNCIVFGIGLALLLATVPGEVLAASDLQITEIYAGTAPKTPMVAGTFDTSEWFEVTNFGDTAADLATNPVYYDDESADPTKNTQLLGVDSIAAGESVVFLLDWESDLDGADDAAKLALARELFAEAWGELPGVQIGYCSNTAGGLGSNGDTMYIFDSNLAGANILDSEGYSRPAEVAQQPGTYVSQPDGTWNGADGNPGSNDIAGVDVPGWAANVQFGSDADGWITLSGSPGAVVPEPGTVTLLGMGLLGLLACVWRKRK